MSRPQSSAEKWERKKTYLIRSLFEEVPFLSPIQEEEAEPVLSDDDFRSESTLPDLIIEVEPKKPNPHDEEDEEFYESLAKEMRRLYKRDHNIDSSTASSRSHESLKNNRIEQSSSSTASGYNSSFQQLITQTEVNAHVEGDSVNLEGGFEGLAETSNASKRNTGSSELSSHFSTELMRRVQDFTSFGSLPRYERSKSDSGNVIGEKDLSLEVQPMELAEEISYGLRESSSCDLSNLLNTSTPVSKQNSKIVRKKIQRRLDPYTAHSYSTSRRDVGGVDAPTQTSFSDDEPDWSTFWNNFFVGNSTVYSLCSCRNHVCS